MKEHKQVLDFWFEELSSKDWYVKNPDLDEDIRKRFGAVQSKAAQGELFSWRQSFEGRVAEIIVLDQFSRNMFRDDPRAFACDVVALVLAQEAVALGGLGQVNDQFKHHILLPYMHSESVVVHEQAMILREEHNLDTDYELRHKRIIDQFGRYPHRNEVLGRPSTPEELEFLKTPGSSF